MRSRSLGRRFPNAGYELHPSCGDFPLSARSRAKKSYADLLKSVARRIFDWRVLHLIRMWLNCPVEETDKQGRKTRTTEA